jgi:cobalt-zinc-cadmium efflux system outer membrane protein
MALAQDKGAGPEPPAGATQPGEPGSPLPASITLEEAVARAVARHPDVLAAQQGVRAARFGLRSARSLPNPTLSADTFLSVPPLNGQAILLDASLSEVIETSGRRGIRSRVARQQLNSNQFQLQETGLDTALTATSAFYDLLAAQETLTAQRENLANATQLFDLTQRQFDVGRAPQADVLKQRVELSRTRQDLLAAEGTLATARAALIAAVGEPDGTQLAAIGEMAFRNVPVDEGALLAQALEARPAVKKARADVAAQRAQAALTAVQRRPDVTLSVERDAIDQINIFRAAVDFPLFDLGQIRYDVAQQRALASQLEATLAGVRVQVAQAVHQAIASVKQLNSQLHDYRTEILEPSEKLLTMAELAYREGNTGILPLLEAQRTLREARTEYLNLLKQYNQAVATLERAVGTPLREQPPEGVPGPGESKPGAGKPAGEK